MQETGGGANGNSGGVAEEAAAAAAAPLELGAGGGGENNAAAAAAAPSSSTAGGKRGRGVGGAGGRSASSSSSSASSVSEGAGGRTNATMGAGAASGGRGGEGSGASLPAAAAAPLPPAAASIIREQAHAAPPDSDDSAVFSSFERIVSNVVEVGTMVGMPATATDMILTSGTDLSLMIRFARDTTLPPATIAQLVAALSGRAASSVASVAGSVGSGAVGLAGAARNAAVNIGSRAASVAGSVGSGAVRLAGSVGSAAVNVAGRAGGAAALAARTALDLVVGAGHLVSIGGKYVLNGLRGLLGVLLALCPYPSLADIFTTAYDTLNGFITRGRMITASVVEIMSNTVIPGINSAIRNVTSYVVASKTWLLLLGGIAERRIGLINYVPTFGDKLYKGDEPEATWVSPNDALASEPGFDEAPRKNFRRAMEILVRFAKRVAKLKRNLQKETSFQSMIDKKSAAGAQPAKKYQASSESAAFAESRVEAGTEITVKEALTFIAVRTVAFQLTKPKDLENKKAVASRKVVPEDRTWTKLFYTAFLVPIVNFCSATAGTALLNLSQQSNVSHYVDEKGEHVRPFSAIEFSGICALVAQELEVVPAALRAAFEEVIDLSYVGARLKTGKTIENLYTLCETLGIRRSEFNAPDPDEECTGGAGKRSRVKNNYNYNSSENSGVATSSDGSNGGGGGGRGGSRFGGAGAANGGFGGFGRGGGASSFGGGGGGGGKPSPVRVGSAEESSSAAAAAAANTADAKLVRSNNDYASKMAEYYSGSRNKQIKVDFTELGRGEFRGTVHDALDILKLYLNTIPSLFMRQYLTDIDTQASNANGIATYILTDPSVAPPQGGGYRRKTHHRKQKKTRKYKKARRSTRVKRNRKSRSNRS